MYMKFNLRNQYISPTDSDLAQMQEKLDRLDKHLLPPYVADVHLIHDQHHRSGEVVTCIINIEHGKRVFHTERTGGTIQDALDEAIEAVRRELKKYHDIQRKEHRA